MSHNKTKKTKQNNPLCLFLTLLLAVTLLSVSLVCSLSSFSALPQYFLPNNEIYLLPFVFCFPLRNLRVSFSLKKKKKYKKRLVYFINESAGNVKGTPWLMGRLHSLPLNSRQQSSSRHLLFIRNLKFSVCPTYLRACSRPLDFIYDVGT